MQSVLHGVVPVGEVGAVLVDDAGVGVPAVALLVDGVDAFTFAAANLRFQLPPPPTDSYGPAG